VDESDVVVLTKDNFDSIVKGDLTLVEFYAPWCGHCKKLTPEYAKAATQLKGEVVLGKLDATVETEVASRFGVSGYPTLKVFRSGTPSDYNGPRDAAGIVKFMQKQVGPSAKEIKTSEELKTFQDHSDISVVGFFPQKKGAAYDNFLAAANAQRDNFRFAIVTEASVIEGSGFGQAIVIFKSFDEGKNIYTGSNTVSSLVDWIYAKSIAQVGEFTRDNANRYKHRNLPILKVYVDVKFASNPKQAGYYINRVKKALGQNKEAEGKLLFSVANKKDFAEEVKNLGLDSAEVAVGIESEGLKYRTADTFSVESLDKFIKLFLSGGAKPYIKSEPAPPKAQPGHVQVVVGETFNDIVMDPTKDVLLEMYAPWCGHCKKLEPIYDELAKKLKDEPSVVIAKIDATANDSPVAEYAAKGYPTIFYAPANSKKNPIKYEGAREVKDFYKWLQEKKTLPWSPKKPKVTAGESKDEL